MCEIVSAGSAIPQQCRPLEPPKAKAGLGGSRGSGTTLSDENTSAKSGVASRQLGQCLQALESRPQWWTSYSNSRQNAVVMCKAAREDIAKGGLMTLWIREVMGSLIGSIDDLIKLHQSMVHADTEAHSALSKSVQRAHEGLTEQLKFAAAVEAFQQRLLRDLESSSVESRSYFERAVKSMESVTFDVINRLANAAKSAGNGVADLDEVRSAIKGQSRRLIMNRTFTNPTPRFWTYRRMSVASFSKLCQAAPSLPRLKACNGRRARI